MFMIVLLYAYFCYYSDVESREEKVWNKCMKTQLLQTNGIVDAAMNVGLQYTLHKTYDHNLC